MKAKKKFKISKIEEDYFKAIRCFKIRSMEKEKRAPRLNKK